MQYNNGTSGVKNATCGRLSVKITPLREFATSWGTPQRLQAFLAVTKIRVKSS